MRRYKHYQPVPKVRFKESDFDINGKKWIIEKNGELVFSEKQLSAEKCKAI